MRIIRVLIEKKIENEHILLNNNLKEFAYSEHISAYLHSLFFLGLEDPLFKYKQKLWKRFISSSGNSKLKLYKELLEFKQKQDQIILMALNKLEEMKSEDSEFGSLYKPYTWGIQSYEVENE